MKHLLLVALILFGIHPAFGQCNPNQKLVEISITPDNYPQETTWSLYANGTLVQTGNFQGAAVCVPIDACVQFTINDSYGDGICCGFGQGSYSVAINGQVLATGGQFTYSMTHTFDCPPGSSCDNPLVIETGQHLAPQGNYFYTFTPSTTGMYRISTCGLSTCDTKIWVYQNCSSYVSNEDNTGTIFYDDDNSTCSLQAVVDAYFAAGTTYIIRIGTKNGQACVGGIPFNLSFEGEIVGCTDINACNYNPLATIPDGSCMYFGNPNCPGGPDLLILENVVVNSLQLRQELATNCMVAEGCMNGYGERTVLAFDTHIKNIGDMDYYVGNPTANPDQFTFQNCHGHPHYEGYAKYTLFSLSGDELPIGQKNGFCVMDLECSDGGTAQYGCSNMGITKQCGDIYSRYLECQWIDITDVPPGQYTLAIQVNWDQSPDALGRYETRYDNNWAQACIEITEVNGIKGFQVLTPCEPYSDCLGTPYGNAQVDCEGVCGGSRVRGDLDNNGTVQVADAQAYVAGILDGSVSPTACNDISGDGLLSVWDAALATNCGQNSVNPNNCQFPNTVTNLAQVARIGNLVHNNEEHYVDVYLQNDDCKILGYDLNFSGMVIADVASLISPMDYPVSPSFSASNYRVIGLSHAGQHIPKNPTFTPFLRVFYTHALSYDLCLEGVIHVVNENHEPISVELVNNCLSIAATQEAGLPEFNVFPNPVDQQLEVALAAVQSESFEVHICDATGRMIRSVVFPAGSQHLFVPTAELSSGLYTIQLVQNGLTKTKRFVKK